MTTCRHFDREGLARAERGLPDPHVDGCADCQAARADYERLRAAIAESGAAFVPPAGWEDRVLAEVDRAGPGLRRAWWLAGAAVAAAAALVLWWQIGRAPTRPPSSVAELEVVHGSQIVRSRSPAVGDGLRVRYRGDRAAIWIYRGDRLALPCSRVEDPNSTGTPDGTCTLSAGVVLADLAALRAATYHVISVQTELRAPRTLDEALALLTRAGVPYTDAPIIVE